MDQPDSEPINGQPVQIETRPEVAEVLGVMTCGMCRHAYNANPTNLTPNASLECHRYPPVPAPVIQQKKLPNGMVQMEVQTFTAFPMVLRRTPICGEFGIKLTRAH